MLERQGYLNKRSCAALISRHCLQSIQMQRRRANQDNSRLLFNFHLVSVHIGTNEL